ncbi:MAG: polysaccharide biosynthesis/export family protein [Burkholderiales bacterium]|nr:polysaccharide biosynthesis/export family protein [Burkholderiales bacterium]
MLKRLLYYITISSLVTSCAFMPRTTLEADNVNIVESLPNSQLKLQVKPLDSQALVGNGVDSYHYILGKGDQFVLYVWGHPEFSSPLGISAVGDKSSAFSDGINDVNNTLSNASMLSDIRVSSYTIDEEGGADIPMIGRIKMAGRDSAEIKKELTSKLKKYVVDPQVSLRVVAFRSKKSYILGEVTTPKTFYLSDTPLDLASMLVAAGWVNLASADVKNIYVLRLVNDSMVDVYRLDATSAANLLFASSFVLKSNDIVFVSTAGIAQFGRIMIPLMTTAQSLWFVTNLVPVGTKIVPQ